MIVATRADIPKARVYGTSGGASLVLPELAIDGRIWRDAGRLYVPRWVSYLSALRPDRSEDDWREYFAWAVQTGFTGVRTFMGNIGWASGQTPESALARLPRYLEVATECRMVVEVTALTGTADHPYDPKHYIADVADIIRPYAGHVVLELSNEFEHGSQDLDADELEAWGKQYCDGILWAIGAPSVDEPDPDGYWPGVGGRYGSAHLDRGRPTPWEQSRRVREIYACSEETGTPVLNNESLGADEKDGSETGRQRSNDPAFFATLGALDRGFSGVGGVHHSQAGLDAVLPGPIQQQCADAYVAAHRAVDSVLGQDIPAYRNAGHVDSPVLSFSDAVRCYSFTTGNRGVTVGLGLGPDPGIRWGNGFQPTSEPFSIQAKDTRWLRVWEVRR